MFKSGNLRFELIWYECYANLVQIFDMFDSLPVDVADPAAIFFDVANPVVESLDASNVTVVPFDVADPVVLFSTPDADELEDRPVDSQGGAR